jgi:hypothetical protein
MAAAPKIPREKCDMLVGPSPHGDAYENAREPARFRATPSLNRVQIFWSPPGTTPGPWESSRQPVIPLPQRPAMQGAVVVMPAAPCFYADIPPMRDP